MTTTVTSRSGAGRILLAGGLAVLASVATAGMASAQDASLRPNFGTANLSGGFRPDPHVVNLTAGGDIDASSLGGACAGKITSAPDYRINYQASGGLALTVRVRSQTDTTLVINKPNGQWSCSDDVSGINPGLVFRNAASGVYDIWVGTYGDEPASGQLRITELE